MSSTNGPVRIGIGGPVGSGKTALTDRLCKAMRDHYNIAAITNDIYTREDAEFLTRSGGERPFLFSNLKTNHGLDGVIAFRVAAAGLPTKPIAPRLLPG